MKKIILSLFMLPVLAHAQNVGIGTNNPDASALLHLNSTTKGILIPSMTGIQRIALSNPAEGLLVYDLSQKKTFQYQNGQWRIFITSDYWSHSETRRWVYNGTDSIGIGTASVQDKLHVHNGNIRLTGDLKVSGHAGIGTQDPQALLHVQGSSINDRILFQSQNPTILLSQSNIPNPGYTTKGLLRLNGDDVVIGTVLSNSSGKFAIQTNGGTKVTVDNDGDVNLNGGKLTSTATGSNPLTPVAYGRTASVSTGGIARGTSNVTVFRQDVGVYIVSCPEFTPDTVFITSGVGTGITIGAVWAGANAFSVRIAYSNGGGHVDQLFNFVAF